MIVLRLALVLAIATILAAAAGRPAMGLNMLSASGTNLVDSTGKVVTLNGVNLGAWLVMEGWMCPMDSSGLPDEYSVVSKLDSRFGVAEEQSLIDTYRSNWITTADLQNIKNLGFNCVRVPVWWGDFYTLSQMNASGPSMRSDAFTYLDWLVNACSSQGIYVVIDMHGVFGGQSTSQDCGQQNNNTYWTNGNYQGNTALMWWEIANHYKGNATVAGYDLINEPDGAPSSSAVLSAYSGLYNSVRSADSGHLIIMEGTWGNWDWSMLPAPSAYGWTNVMYEMHEYQYGGSQSQVETGDQNQVNDFNNHKSWNVPDYIGEFNDMGYGAAVTQYSTDLFNANRMSWTMWAYKGTNGLNTNGWGQYDPTYWAATPNIQTSSAATIAADWAEWTTAATFTLNNSVSLPTPTSTIGNGTYTLAPMCSTSSRLDDSSGGTTNGNMVQIWQAGWNANQNWSFANVGGSTWNLAVIGAYCLEAAGTTSGSALQLWSCNGSNSEKWASAPVTGGYNFALSGYALCLDVSGAGTANGTAVQIYTCNGTPAQDWILAP